MNKLTNVLVSLVMGMASLGIAERYFEDFGMGFLFGAMLFLLLFIFMSLGDE